MDTINQPQVSEIPDNSQKKTLIPNSFKKTGLFIVFSVISAVIFGFWGFKNFWSIGIYICGDVACSFAQAATILLIFFSTLITFMLPGIFLFSVLYKNWKLPLFAVIFTLIPELLTFAISIFQDKSLDQFREIAGVIKFSGFVQSLLSGPLWAILMLVIYSISLLTISFLIHGLSNINNFKISRFILSTELFLFTGVIAISAFVPATFQKIERAVNPQLKTTNPGYGNIYYQENSSITSVDSNGNKKSFQLPNECGHIRISWDQSEIFCSKDDTFGVINTKTSKSTSVKDSSIMGSYPSSQYSWSSDNKYLLLSSGFTMDSKSLTDLYRLDVANMKIEKISQGTLTSGYINKAVYSPDNGKIAFDFNSGSPTDRENTIIKILDLNSNQINDVTLESDCGSDCYITYLQFSSDSKKLFMTTETYVKGLNNPEGNYQNKFTLIELSNSTKKEFIKYTKLSTFSGTDAKFLFNGIDSVVYYGPFGEKTAGLKKINLTENKEQELQKTTGDISRSFAGSYLAFNGDWVVYRVKESGTYVTYLEKIGGERLRVLNNGEFVLVANDSHPTFVYWFK